MNKKIFGFIFVFTFLFTNLFINQAFAVAPNLSVLSAAQTSVIIKATGFVPNKEFSISVVNNQNSKTASYSKNVDVSSDSSGNGQATFLDLIPGGNYITTASGASSLSFSTYLNLTSNKGVLVSKNSYADTIVLELSDAIPDESYDVDLYTDPNYKDNDLIQKVYKTNASGYASQTFSDLLGGAHYIAQFKPISSDTWSDPIFIVTPLNTNSSSLDFSALNGTIKIVSDRLDGTIVEGTELGQYKAGSKSTLKKALSDAEYYNGDASAFVQSDIDKATSLLQNALDTFELGKVTATDIKNNLKDNGGIVPRCNVGEIDPTTNQYKIPCDFTFFMKLINSVIKFLLFTIATPFLALIIIYIAYLFLTSGGSNQTEKAKHVLFNVVVGYVIALAAWLIINTIVSTLNVDPSINTFMDRLPK